MNLYGQAFSYPIGSKKKEKPSAVISTPLTTVQLVKDNEPDAEFFRALEKQGIELNQEQLDAVRSTTGPQLVLAGAGSGKTRALTARTSYILTYDKKVQPNQIMLLTFTRKAAEEMIDRMQRMPHITKEMVDSLICGTFHSVFLKMLRKKGYRQKILSSEGYREVIFKNIIRQHKLEDLYSPEIVGAAISEWKNQLLSEMNVIPQIRTEHEMLLCYRSYEEWKRENSYMDFDDILIFALDLLRRDEDFANSLRSTLKYICVDEYQDVNLIQHEILKCLTHENSNIFMVGDPDQLIYAFRHSSTRFIMSLKEVYPSLRTITLTTNYRSKQAIVAAANQVIQFNKERLEKESHALIGNEGQEGVFYFRPAEPEQEALWIVDHIVQQARAESNKLSDFAVLYRTHSASRAIVDELVYRGIPFVVYGNEQLFYENRNVKPLLAHLRLIIHPDDLDAIADIAPTMYVAREEAYRFALDFMFEEPDKPAIHSLLKLKVTPFQKAQIVKRIALLDKLQGLPPMEVIQRLRKAFYDDFLDAKERNIITMQKDYIQEVLNEFEASAKRFSLTASYIQFIDQITEIYNSMEKLRKSANPEAVKLMTIHQSKGLEFPVVALIGVSEGLLPHNSSLNADMQKDRVGGMTTALALEEERRLLYVAMTRAENELFVSSPKTYHNKDAEVSRFLLEAYS